MNVQLRARIAQVREILENSHDETIGFLAPPSLHFSFPKEVPVAYQEFLREADGAMCGVVMLYESDGILQKQDDVKNLPEGRRRWFCIGAVEDYPLVIDVRSGAVHLVPLEGELDLDDSLGDLDYFLLTSIFGPDYADFVIDAADDPWYQLVNTQAS